MRYLAFLIALIVHPINLLAGSINNDVISAWYTCSLTMVHDAGINDWTIPLTYKKFSANKDPQFLILLHAVVHAESRFQGHLVSSAKAYGLMQVTDVAMREAAAQCNYPIIPVQKLFDNSLNIKYGSCYLDFLYRSTGGSIDRTLIVYNGGYRQLQKYDRGLPIAAETANYILHVRRAMSLCKR